MRLTQKQEWLVARYVRAVGEELGDVPDGVREQAIERIKGRIKRELKAFTTSPLRDPQVIGVLQRLGPPAEQAGTLRAGCQKPLLVLSVTDRVWLGVCGGIGEYLEVDPLQVRFTAVVLGLMTGPLALIVYLALYFEMYNAARHSELRQRVPRIDAVELLRVTGGTVMAVAALDLTARLALMLLDGASARLSVQPSIDLGPWEWVRLNLTWLMYAALFALAPVAVLAGLHVAGHWELTGKRVIYAAVAVYALVLCFGIALSVVGVILQVAARVSIS
ncbi:MAG: PspC domain-containing protein [Candidatus Hydrogenedentes bacterium]|nr:PspC domain-containing protein [Candidatus Hydrogenedentota bacterium]